MTFLPYRERMRAFPASVAAVSCLVLAAGCAGKDDAPQTAPAGESPSVQTSSSAPEPDPTPTVPSPTPTAKPTPADLPLVDRLMPTRQVPGLNAQWHWQDGATGSAGAIPFGFCAKADLASIGASSAFERTYFSPEDSDDSAAEQVAEFPDAKTASLAWSVLKSWHDRCGKEISANIGLRVRPLTPVAVDAGSAQWYLLSWTPPGEETGRFEAFGMVLNGTRIGVLRMDNSGLDYNYPAGKEPMARMVRAAAGWLD